MKKAKIEVYLGGQEEKWEWKWGIPRLVIRPKYYILKLKEGKKEKYFELNQEKVEWNEISYDEYYNKYISSFYGKLSLI